MTEETTSEKWWFSMVVDRIPSTIAGASVILIVTIVMGVVVLRNFGVGTVGFNAIAQILGVWTIFVLMGALALERRHIQIDYFSERLPEPWKRYHDLVAQGVVVVACMLLLYSAVLATIASAGNTVTAPTLLPIDSIPMPAYFSAAIVGTVLMTVVYSRDLWRTLDLNERLAEVRGGE